MQRPSQGVALGAIARLTAGAGATGAVALAFAVALLHGIGQVLRPLAQGIERLSLRIDRTVGIAFAELAAGIAHRVIGGAKPILVVAGLRVAVLTWLLALLTVLTALVWSHAALGQIFLQFLQPVAQALLVLLEIAHGLIALLAALAVAPRILALLERLVAQLLLLADHVAELVQRLLHVVIAGLAGLGELQALQHLLQLIEQLLRRVLVAGARQPLQAVEHVVEVLLTHDLGVGIERPGQGLRIVAKLLGQLAHEVIERRAQILGELPDFLVAGAALEGLLERVLGRTKRLVDIGDVAILDRDRERPQARHRLAHRIVGSRQFKFPRHAAQAEIVTGCPA